MATSADKRIAKWDAKFNTERVKATLDDLRPDMLASVSAVFPLLATMESEVKQVLDGEGVSVILYPFYLGFGRELWRLQRNNLSGESLAIEAQTLIQKWVARGLSQTVLEKLRTDVFSVSAPTP
jgi:hypothetical protein